MPQLDVGVGAAHDLCLQLASAGLLPGQLGPLIAACAALTALMVGTRLCAPQQVLSQKAWHVWQALTGTAGLVVVPQVLLGTFFGVQSLWPAAVSAVSGASAAQGCVALSAHFRARDC